MDKPPPLFLPLLMSHQFIDYSSTSGTLSRRLMCGRRRKMGWEFGGCLAFWFPTVSSLGWGGQVGALKHLLLRSHLLSKISFHGNPTIWLVRDGRQSGRDSLWRPSLSGGAMEHISFEECVISIRQLRRQTVRGHVLECLVDFVVVQKQFWFTECL